MSVDAEFGTTRWSSMRLFVAIELMEPVVRCLERVQAILRPRFDDVRWVRADLMHLTVKFIGDVPDEDVQYVAMAVEESAAATESFRIRLDGLGCFPPRGPVRVVWAGMSEPSGTLEACAELVNGKLKDVGIPAERRPFASHITLGRVRADRSNGRMRETVGETPLKSADQLVNSVTLMSSTLASAGPTYHAVSRVPFGGTDVGPD